MDQEFELRSVIVKGERYLHRDDLLAALAKMATRPAEGWDKDTLLALTSMIANANIVGR